MWFVLSEQSRYIIALGVPLSVIAGGAVVRLRAGLALAVGIVVQALFGFYLIKTFRFDTQVQVLKGAIPVEQYRAAGIRFYEPAQYLNEVAKGGRVALFDEVFGFELEVPYFWANPGHSNELGYESMKTADDFVASLKKNGFTHVYLEAAGADPKWVAAFGLNGAPQPYPAEERSKLMEDLNWRWKILLAEAVASHQLALDRAFGSRLVFRIQ
jgi:hypothetical protein